MQYENRITNINIHLHNYFVIIKHTKLKIAPQNIFRLK